MATETPSNKGQTQVSLEPQVSLETYWTIPAIGGKFHSEKDAFKFLGQLWGRISGLLFNDWQRYEVEHELEGYGKRNWFNSLKCDDLKWNDSRLDVYAKRLFKLFDEYMTDNEWDEEIIDDYLSYGLKDGKVEYFKRDHLPTEDKVTSATPEDFWNELAHKNDGKFFVWPLDCYGEGKTLPAYWGMVPQVIYDENLYEMIKMKYRIDYGIDYRINYGFDYPTEKISKKYDGGGGWVRSVFAGMTGFLLGAAVGAAVVYGREHLRAMSSF